MIRLFFILKKYFYIIIFINALIIFYLKRNFPEGHAYFMMNQILIISLGFLYGLMFAFRFINKRFHVFLSFSASRSQFWSRYIRTHLKHLFWTYNISYYDYRDYPVEYDQMDIPNICNEISNALENSDVYARFFDENVEARPITRQGRFYRSKFNWYTGKITDSNPDYYKFEVNESYNKFNNKFVRYQFSAPGSSLSTSPHITNLIPWPGEGQIKFGIRAVQTMRNLFFEGIYLR